MKAIKMCERIKTEIEEKDTLYGYVHSVFSRSCNLLTNDNHLISILSNEKPISPFSITLNRTNSFIELGINQGMRVVIDNKNLKIKELDFDIDISRVKLWNPKPDFCFAGVQETDFIDRLKTIEDYIFNYGKLDGIAPLVFNVGDYVKDLKLFKNRKVKLNQYCSFILNRFIEYLKTITEYKTKDISDVTKQIIGFGPGLTPSTDDLLSGIMVSFVYLANYYDLDVLKIIELNNKMIKDVLCKTTRESYKMLKFAARGEVSEHVRALLVSMLNHSTDEEFKSNIINVLNFGETSGTDILCGIYTGFKIMLNEDNRRFLINESQR